MMKLDLNYLAECSLCLLIFMAIYKWLLSGLTHFAWMRLYLLLSLGFSLVLPFAVVPLPWDSGVIPAGSFPDILVPPVQSTEPAALDRSPQLVANPEIPVSTIIIYSIVAVYAMGVLYKLFLFVRNLTYIFRLIRNGPKTKEDNYWIVEPGGSLVAFSFFHYIFINNRDKQLSAHELQMIKEHEGLHARHYHTLDLLFVELAGILFWFHPSMNYLKRALREVHEYSVDEKVAGRGENKKAYATLLLSLASETQAFDLATGFNGEQVGRRIFMMAKPRTSMRSRWMFVLLLPLIGVLLLLFSCVKSPAPKLSAEPAAEAEENFWAIRWKLQKYCGIYLPSEKNAFLGPLKIGRMEDQLFRIIETSEEEHQLTRFKESDPPVPPRVIELQHKAGHTYAYGYRNVFKIQFVLDDKDEVTGCFFTQREGLGFNTYEFIKQKNR